MQKQKTEKEKGNEEFKKQNYRSAIEHYRNYLQQQHEDNNQALLNIALAYSKLGEFDAAIEACNESQAIDEKNPKCYYRRAMCRNQLLKIQPNNKVLKYKLYYDSIMFEKYCQKGEFIREIQQITKLGLINKQQLLASQPIKLSQFQRDLMELEKDNISLFALSWLDQKSNLKKISTPEQRINDLYKQMIAVKRQLKDSEQAKAMVQHIKNKIKQIRNGQQTMKNRERLKSNDLPQKIDQYQKIQLKVEQNYKQANKINKNTQKQLSKKQDDVQTNAQIPSNSAIETTLSQKHNQQKISAIDNKQQKQQSQINSKKQISTGNQAKKTQSKASQNYLQKSPQFLYNEFFVKGVQKSRDIFETIGSNLLLLLKQPNNVTNQAAQYILGKLRQKKDFKLMLVALPKNIKNQLKQLIPKIGISQQIRKSYNFK